MFDKDLYLSQINEAYEYINQKLLSSNIMNSNNNPAISKIGIICGSGLGGLANLLTSKLVINYSDIPHFPLSTITGHEGYLAIGYLSNKLIYCLVVTNACGGLNPSYKVGDICVIYDHISLSGMCGINPLVGSNLDEFGTRFPATSNLYSERLRNLVFDANNNNNTPIVNLHEGIYTYTGGPSYETRAEARFLRMIGGDVVGMSSAHEAIVANHCQMEICTLSLVSNMVVTKMHDTINKKEYTKDSHMNQQFLTLETNENLNPPSHEEVLEAGRRMEKLFENLIHNLINLI